MLARPPRCTSAFVFRRYTKLEAAARRCLESSNVTFTPRSSGVVVGGAVLVSCCITDTIYQVITNYHNQSNWDCGSLLTFFSDLVSDEETQARLVQQDLWSGPQAQRALSSSPGWTWMDRRLWFHFREESTNQCFLLLLDFYVVDL